MRAKDRLTSVSSIHRLEPLKEIHPCEFHLTYEALDALRQTSFTVDTEVGFVAEITDI